jgi:hypothetical protein
VVAAGYPAKPDLRNTTDRTQPQSQYLGSKDYPLRIERHREHQTLESELTRRTECAVEPVAQRLYAVGDQAFEFVILILGLQ